MLNFLLETFLLGLKNLRLHKLRSLLTALGIILGVAAVIIMVAIGEGAKQDGAGTDRAARRATTSWSASSSPPESNDASEQTQRMLEYGLSATDLERLRDARRT